MQWSGQSTTLRICGRDFWTALWAAALLTLVIILSMVLSAISIVLRAGLWIVIQGYRAWRAFRGSWGDA